MRYVALIIGCLIVIVAGCSVSPTTLQPVLNPSPAAHSADLAEPDIAAVIAREAEVMREVQSCRISLTLESDFKSESTARGEVSISTEMTSAIDAGRRLLSTVISTNLTSADSETSLTQEIIADGNRVYTRDDKQSAWEIHELNEDAADNLWEEQTAQLTGSQYTEALSADGFIYSGIQQIDGCDCFVFKQALDRDAILRISPEMVAQLQETQGVTDAELQGLDLQADLECLVDSRDYYLRRLSIRADVNQTFQGQIVRGYIQQVCLFEGFNEPVSVQIPDVE